MNKIYLKATFLLLCLTMQIICDFSYTTCVPFLMTLTFCCAYEIVTNNKVQTIISILFLICIARSSNLCFYLSLWFLANFHEKQKYMLILCALPLLHIHQSLHLFTIVLSIMACYLKYSFDQFDFMSIHARHQRDSLAENTLLLEEKNKSLIREKEYEIQIATLNERNRIARDIHDNIGHILSSSLLQTGALQAINQQENMIQPIQDLQNTLKKGMESARKSVHDLYDTSIDFKLEIEKQLKEYAQLPIHFSYTIENIPNSRTISQLLSILSEGLHNIEKHSSPTRIELVLKEQKYFYQFILFNDGIHHPIQSGGIGLKNMKTRVYEMNGNINITCTEKEFKIFITIPKENNL